MPASSKTERRLKRLAESGICSSESASEYAAELEKLADKNMSKENAARKGRVFKALSDSTRLRILGLLLVREMCVCEVMAALNLTQPTASHHLGILENAELIKDRKQGKWVFYSIANLELIEGMRKLNIL
jgi:DNA-binding transcriptional ArsR family regulator